MQVRKVLTHISKSDPMKAVFNEAQVALYGKSLKLRNMTMHRWSSAEETIGHVLANWAAILRTYHQRSKRLELITTKKVELGEVYSLLRSINLLLKDLQGGSVTSRPHLIMRINLLLRSDLALDKPLVVVDPAVVDGKAEPEASGRRHFSKHLSMRLRSPSTAGTMRPCQDDAWHGSGRVVHGVLFVLGGLGGGRVQNEFPIHRVILVGSIESERVREI